MFYEKHAEKLGGKYGSIDVFWPGMLIVEQKTTGKNLDSAFLQAIDYYPDVKELPRYIIVCDFARIRLYDLKDDKTREFHLEEFVENVELFDFIAGYTKREFAEQDPVNIEAAERMGRLDKLLEINAPIDGTRAGRETWLEMFNLWRERKQGPYPLDFFFKFCNGFSLLNKLSF